MDALDLALDAIRRDLERRFSDDLLKLNREIPADGAAAEAVGREISDLIQSCGAAMLPTSTHMSVSDDNSCQR